MVDEEIYRRLPTLLIATVDKFAQMPWNGEVQMLFGQVDGLCERHGFRSPEIEDADCHPKTGRKSALRRRSHDHPPLRPPDLIIQDELHLISGPLGHARRALRDGHRQALLVGGRRQDGPAQGDRLDGDDPEGRRTGPALFLRTVNVFPPQRRWTCGTTSSRSSASRQRGPCRAGATSASAPRADG